MIEDGTPDTPDQDKGPSEGSLDLAGVLATVRELQELGSLTPEERQTLDTLTATAL